MANELRIPNLALPGNPRYQPKDLVEDFGYDRLARTFVEVELASLYTLADMGIVPQADMLQLNQGHVDSMLSITTSEMDKVEREVTGHDVRALVRLMQEIIPAPLRRWVHAPNTSFDVLDTARILMFLRVHRNVVKPKTGRLIKVLRNQAVRYRDQVQIGRTHGKHALPITVGFWLATILGRVLFNAGAMNQHADGLVGKIAGAVGAQNAQYGLGILAKGDFETLVLKRLGLRPAPISTQILAPEPLAYYLFSALMLSGTFGQLGTDGRQLMRTEISEIMEPFETGQVGSSTMAQKRNPVNFETVVAAWLKNKAEFLKVLETIISEHQRDLTGSAVSRDFPTLIVNLVTQLDTLMRKGKEDPRPFLERISVDTERCKLNLEMTGDRILAEPLYLALQMYGFEGDAHKLVSDRAMPLADQHGGLVPAIEVLAATDEDLKSAWNKIPSDIHALFRSPETYIGNAREKVDEIVRHADVFLARC